MANQQQRLGHGPFRAEQLREGDRYELSNGHPVYCAPAGRDHAGPNVTGAAVIDTDPDVAWVGVDAGFSPEPGTLRAPDVAVAAPGAEEGWIPGAPPLAVEYASRGQDEADLRLKIAEFLAAGTRIVWVVRLTGVRRVEIHRPGQPIQVAGPGDLLEAPGILRNPVPCEALYDRAAGHRTTLRNLLQREGYDSLEAVREEGREAGREAGREEGREEGIAEAILALLADRGLAVDAASRGRIQGCRDRGQLLVWLVAAARVEVAAGIFDAAADQDG